MTIAEIFSKFDLPTALIIVLLLFIAAILRMYQKDISKREEKYEARLEALQTRADENNDKFIAALSDQNKVTEAIARMLTPIQAATDLLPSIDSAADETRKDVARIIDLIVRDRKSK